MVTTGDLPTLPGERLQAYRLVNSKFPPIALFDDVADADEFEVLTRFRPSPIRGCATSWANWS